LNNTLQKQEDAEFEESPGLSIPPVSIFATYLPLHLAAVRD
jgi:hypothetical protein